MVMNSSAVCVTVSVKCLECVLELAPSESQKCVHSVEETLAQLGSHCVLFALNFIGRHLWDYSRERVC